MMKSRKTRMIIGCTILLIFSCIYGYLYFFRGMRIMNNPQKNYAKFLIENNDKLIDLFFEFDQKTNKEKIEYTEEEKNSLKDLILKQDNIVKLLQRYPPNENNKDYEELYNDMLESYFLFIQGELMEMEKIYGEDDVGEERLILGRALENMMGNIIIEFGEKVNAVRNTDIPYKWTYNPEINPSSGNRIQKNIENNKSETNTSESTDEQK